jgi:transcriptional regulator with XRE-family HTH domain
MLDKRINQKKMAELLGLDPGAVSRLMSGERRLQLGEAAELSLILEESLDEILVRFGVIDDAKKVSLTLSGYIDPASVVNPMKEGISIPPPQSAIGKLECVQIRGDSALDRSIVFFGDAVGVVTDRLCLHLLPGSKVVIGVAYKGYVPGSYKIKGLFGNEIESNIESSRIVADIAPI